MFPIYRSMLLVAAGLVLAVGPTAGAAAAAPANTGRSPAAAPAGSDRVLTVFGAGPYRFGASLSGLSAAGLIDSIADHPLQPHVTVATSTREWAGELSPRLLPRCPGPDGDRH